MIRQLVPETVTPSRVAELGGDDASESWTQHALGQRSLGHTSRPKINVCRMSVPQKKKKVFFFFVYRVTVLKFRKSFVNLSPYYTEIERDRNFRRKRVNCIRRMLSARGVIKSFRIIHSGEARETDIIL